MLCYAALRCAALCYAMLRYAALRYAMICYAMICYAMLCYAMRRCATLCAPPLGRRPLLGSHRLLQLVQPPLQPLALGAQRGDLLRAHLHSMAWHGMAIGGAPTSASVCAVVIAPYRCRSLIFAA